MAALLCWYSVRSCAEAGAACLLLQGLCWKEEPGAVSVRTMQPPLQRERRTPQSVRRSQLQAPARTSPSQDGLGSCHMLGNILLHKWPGHKRARIYPLLIIASTYLLPAESRTVVFSTVKEHSYALCSNWHWGEEPNAGQTIVLNPMRYHNMQYCPCLELEKCELCSRKHQTVFKSKQSKLSIAVWHFQALGQVVRPLWWLGALFKVNSVLSGQTM